MKISYNEELYIEKEELYIKTRFNNEIYTSILEIRKDPITGFKVRINRNIKNKPRNIINENIENNECIFCNHEKYVTSFFDFEKIYNSNSVLFANKYPYSEYHGVVLLNYNKHNENFSDISLLDLYNSLELIREFYNKIFEKNNEYNILFINLNKGFSAGASQRHLHFQILVEKEPTNYYKIYLNKCKRYFEKYRKFFIEDYFLFEKKLNERIIYDDIIKLWSNFAPFRNNEIIGYFDTFGLFFLNQNKFEDLVSKLYKILVLYEKLYNEFNLTILDTTNLKESRTFPFIRIAQRNKNDIGYMEIFHIEPVISSIPEETSKEIKEKLSNQ